MAKLLIFFLVAYWGYNYWKFRRDYRYYTIMAELLKQDIREKPDYVKKMKLSSALIHIQQYASAYELLNEILNSAPYVVNDKNILLMNMEFCKNPIPTLHGPKNLHHSYWHHFVLNRLSKKRYDFLTEDEYLKTNSILRKMKSNH